MSRSFRYRDGMIWPETTQSLLSDCAVRTPAEILRLLEQLPVEVAPNRQPYLFLHDEILVPLPRDFRPTCGDPKEASMSGGWGSSWGPKE